MEPGIELDIAVANAVGLDVFTPRGIETFNLDDYSNVCMTTPIGLQRYYLGRPDMWQLKPWQPSTDIAVAMELFDKRSGWILWHCELPGCAIHSWRVYRGLDAFEVDLSLAESNISAAHAIALAIIEHDRGRAAYDASVAELGW